MKSIAKLRQRWPRRGGHVIVVCVWSLNCMMIRKIERNRKFNGFKVPGLEIAVALHGRFD
jgi:hypothetical protein